VPAVLVCLVSALRAHNGFTMAQPISTPQQVIATGPSRKVASAIVMAAVGLGAAGLLAAAALWFHYGTVVFFEMIASGISACF
jgi:hypothetical protein